MINGACKWIREIKGKILLMGNGSLLWMEKVVHGQKK